MTDEHSQVKRDILQTQNKQYATKTMVLEDMWCTVFTFAWHSVYVLGQISPYLLSHFNVIAILWPRDDKRQWESQLVITVLVWSTLGWFNKKNVTCNNKAFIKTHSDCRWLMIEGFSFAGFSMWSAIMLVKVTGPLAVSALHTSHL